VEEGRGGAGYMKEEGCESPAILQLDVVSTQLSGYPFLDQNNTSLNLNYQSKMMGLCIFIYSKKCMQELMCS